MKLIEAGHRYQLISLDGNHQQTLQFVKRYYPAGIKIKVYPGTTCQDVLRVIYDRVGFLNDQKYHWVNPIIRFLLKWSIWLFEYRAARQRGQGYWHTANYATVAEMCPICGHTDCMISHD